MQPGRDSKVVDEMARGEPSQLASDRRGWRRVPGLDRDRLVVVLGVLSVIAIHGPLLIHRKFANVDEAYAGAMAERLLSGHELYRGAISQRGPLFYALYELLGHMAGWTNIVAVRMAALLTTLAVILLVALITTRRQGGTAAAFAASLTAFAYALKLPPEDGLALNAELVLTPLLLAATLTVTISLRDSTPKLWPWFVAAVLTGAAACVKQVALAQGLPLLLFALVAVGPRKRRAAVVLAGLMAVPTLFAWRALHRGTWAETLYYTVIYNLRVHVAPADDESLIGRLIHLANRNPTAALMVVFAVVWWVARRRCLQLSVHWLFCQWIVALLVACYPPQQFLHYFVPALALSAIVVSESLSDVLTSSVFRVVTTAFAGALLFLSVAQAGSLYARRGRAAHDESIEIAARYLENAVPASERIFVWGFSPWLYGYSHRASASRFLFVTYPTGFVPWFWDHPEREPLRAVPGAMNDLLGDLAQAQPAYVVDAGNVQMGRPLGAYAEVASWLERSYCFDVRIGAFDLYRRKVADEACRCRPAPSSPVDYFGQAMQVKTLPLAKPEGTVALPASGDSPVRCPD